MADTWPVMQASPYSAGLEIYKFSHPCDYFTHGKAKASTLSLSVLVAIEMFNAMNALSEVHSVTVPANFFTLTGHGSLLCSCIHISISASTHIGLLRRAA